MEKSRGYCLSSIWYGNNISIYVSRIIGFHLCFGWRDCTSRLFRGVLIGIFGWFASGKVGSSTILSYREFLAKFHCGIWEMERIFLFHANRGGLLPKEARICRMNWHSDSVPAHFCSSSKISVYIVKGRTCALHVFLFVVFCAIEQNRIMLWFRDYFMGMGDIEYFCYI